MATPDAVVAGVLRMRLDHPVRGCLWLFDPLQFGGIPVSSSTIRDILDKAFRSHGRSGVVSREGFWRLARGVRHRFVVPGMAGHGGEPMGIGKLRLESVKDGAARSMLNFWWNL